MGVEGTYSAALNTLIIINSIAFGLAQYIESSHHKSFFRILTELKKLNFEREPTNEGLKAVKDEWDTLCNTAPSSLSWIIYSLLWLLVLIALANTYLWLCPSRLWIVHAISILSIIAALLLFCIILYYRSVGRKNKKYEDDKDTLITKEALIYSSFRS